MSRIHQISSSKCFDGLQEVYEHFSDELHCKMRFSIFLPSNFEEPNIKLPTIYFLSGLTCTEQNMITKSGIQRHAEHYKMIVVGPDTSPRNCNVKGEDDRWDLGTGAGFYVDATVEPWSTNYSMYSYITKELRLLVEKNFPQIDAYRTGITGHSMGGHGALVAFFRNPQIYKSVSAFAPISNPVNSEWGIRCFSAYLGPDRELWKEYDATELVQRQPQKSVKIYIDQGSRDEWMSYLSPRNFVEACRRVGQAIRYIERDGYDHSYFFVASFIENHMRHFARELGA